MDFRHQLDGNPRQWHVVLAGTGAERGESEPCLVLVRGRQLLRFAVFMVTSLGRYRRQMPPTTREEVKPMKKTRYVPPKIVGRAAVHPC